MIHFLFAVLITTVTLADPKERLNSLVDTLSSAPASLTGHISVGNEVVLGQSKVPVGPLRPTAALKWRKNKSIGFYLSENELSLNTDEAVVIKVSGIILKIKSIRYKSNGKFEIDLKSPLMEKTLERKMVEAVEERYKAKMDQAFRELSQMRKQRNGNDAKDVVNRILAIFRDTSGPSMFDNVPMYGEINLNFEFPHSRTLDVTEKYVADVRAGDVISAGGKFTRTGNRFSISEINFNSSKGVTFHPVKGSELSMNSLRVMQVTISDRGIEPVMVTGAEETLTGVGQLIALIASAQGVSSMAQPDCDPRIPEIQAYLQKQLNGQLVPLIRQHRPALLRAGIDPQVLNAVEG